jgi:hypothetical protein
MRYRCDKCGTTEWRDFFPERTFHPRYVIFHGVSLGISACIVRSLFEGRRSTLNELGACALIMLVIYGLAVLMESLIIARRGCRSCSSHKLVISK